MVNDSLNLVDELKKSVICPLGEITEDSIEAVIDSSMVEGFFKEVPIIKTLHGLWNVSKRIYEINMLHQTKCFLIGVDSNSIAPKKLEKYQKKMENSPKYVQKETERVLIILDRNIEAKKSLYMGKFYRAFICEEMSSEQFYEMCEIINRLYVSDIETLQSAYENDGVKKNEDICYRHDRLISLGLLEYVRRPGGDTYISPRDMGKNRIQFTEVGREFCKRIF